MQKIVPHLWFDTQAKEAAEFYVSAFGGSSKISGIHTIHDTPSGDVESVSFELSGFSFMAISAGPAFTLNPSISFFVNFDPLSDDNAGEHLDELWNKLSNGGAVLMPLQAYPFSKRYGWIKDKFGVSWQLILTDPAGEPRPKIIPSLLFTGDKCGKAEEATDFYLSIFNDTSRGLIARYPEGMEPDKEGTIMFTDFKLEGVWFAAMDSAQEHAFTFNEAISLIVYCETQEEIDNYWEKLRAGGDPNAQQCGWLQDRYGVSWQVVPRLLEEMISKGSKAQVERVTKAFLPMKKMIIQELEKAYPNT
ncbi:VOC family protein [Pleomorphovibrio marinus]|uniref:VOC family protein n=1 Tax=Pleomorphovibrio marinus TaxID=2164132 RepID=UPI000E0BB03D|nr:VOC family protein [Pleomorphovibrio marinus]